jgi:ATP-dependent helicase/nuclease subunit A
VLLEQFSFKGRQEQAATASNPAIVVTAGAGSGKTLTLVGRYLHLIEQGYPLRSIIAITFTDKAAREMRDRIRKALEEYLGSWAPASTAEDLQNVSTLMEQVEAARISTIHSLCAQILRTHPVEANLDPNFVVLEEGLAATYRTQAMDAALVWTANDPDAAILFSVFRERELKQILATLLSQLPDLPAANDSNNLLDHWGDALETYCSQWLECQEWSQALETLSSFKSSDHQDTMEMARLEVLAFWESIQLARSHNYWNDMLVSLARLRKAISIGGRKGNWVEWELDAVRQAMRTLRQIYDDHLKTLVEKSSWAIDEQVARLLPFVQKMYMRALREYRAVKDDQQALDFDDLERYTARLLSTQPEVRARWQRETRAILVDEFQDTNERQRQIVYALAGFNEAVGSEPAADLFIVGDAKQSIYKFRGADVTIFRQVQKDIRAANGLPIDLDLTFRAHAPMLQVLNFLLAPVLDPEDGMERPYLVPFAPLQAFRQEPNKAQPPYIEFQIGLGEDAGSGRTACTAALAQRLHEIHENEEFDWGDMALLFRSSTAFAAYEAAFESAGIPFVTVAGRGFYDRPEIRDLLNALTAIAYPSDDLALAGLLRSPAIGLSDADLYRLRFSGQDFSKLPLWQALKASANERAVRAYTMINQLHALAGRASVAVVLKQFLDLSNYRAILSSVPEGARMRRNIDKLLSDAHRSRMISMSEFLAYVQTLRDVGLREGEAPVDAGGAVQLMTVHKAKGLEFPLVVIADAAYEHRGGSERTLLDGQGNLLVDLREPENQLRPVAWQLAALEEADKEDAEERRLLYVACTRAREKLMINGHASLRKAGTLSLRGWLKRLGEVIGLAEIMIEMDQLAPFALELDIPEYRDAMACNIYPANAFEVISKAREAETIHEIEDGSYNGPVPDLVAPLYPEPFEPIDNKISSHDSDPPRRVWRVVSRARQPIGPAWVVGKLVHEALRQWYFPDEQFDLYMRTFALEAGLTNQAEIMATIREVRRLLVRFREHPLHAKLESARRYHEVHYVTHESSGIIDLLYMTEEGWSIADFKTDKVRSETDAWQLIRSEGYDQQVRRYARAFALLTGQTARTQLVFLRCNNQVKVMDIR